ncbi:hypothetical protein [Rhizobium halophilum]|uniref:hypothetical protein n=1 Tax=Rhizobium halophilum TaxID=2846852 RepID=UPI001EFEB40F|nr:hypothetical protein [Rhizobium halophilum]MCF6370907.1 hypothetical protein [Rhizobium halophilum]
MDMEKAWKEWWESLGHVARCNRDTARTREAFEAGYLAASRTGGATASRSLEAAESSRRRSPDETPPPASAPAEVDQISMEELGAQPPPLAGKQQT